MTTCPACTAEVLPARDYVTGELVLLDRQPTQGGRVEIKRAPFSGGGGLVAIDHVTGPAARQPAHELHTRTCSSPSPEPVVDLDDDPVRERSGGWRR